MSDRMHGSLVIPESKWPAWIGLFGVVLFAIGGYIGLFVAPAERHMGDVQRIMYVHVPSAWVGMLCFTFAFGAAIAVLWSGSRLWDARMTGAIEVGVVLNGLLLVQGMIWAHATWGVWWDWDVRLTTSLVMFLLFLGILVLRSFVDDPDKRQSWSAVATIVAFVDVPLVYFCVRWWRSLHQVQSSPETVDAAMVLPLRINAFAFLFFAIWLISLRSRLELFRRGREEGSAPARLQEMGRLMTEAPAGVIAGGWGYVIAAYSLTVIVLVGFLWSLLSRSKKER